MNQGFRHSHEHAHAVFFASLLLGGLCLNRRLLLHSWFQALIWGLSDSKALCHAAEKAFCESAFVLLLFACSLELSNDFATGKAAARGPGNGWGEQWQSHTCHTLSDQGPVCENVKCCAGVTFVFSTSERVCEQNRICIYS